MAQAAPLIIALVCILGVIGLAALRIPVPDVLLVGTGMAFGHFLRDVADVAAGRPPAGG